MLKLIPHYFRTDLVPVWSGPHWVLTFSFSPFSGIFGIAWEFLFNLGIFHNNVLGDGIFENSEWDHWSWQQHCLLTYLVHSTSDVCLYVRYVTLLTYCTLLLLDEIPVVSHSVNSRYSGYISICIVSDATFSTTAKYTVAFCYLIVQFIDIVMLFTYTSLTQTSN